MTTLGAVCRGGNTGTYFLQKADTAEVLMKLPGWEHAYIDDQKLVSYCLNPEHPEGRHKARVFYSTLGLRQSDWSLLKEALIYAVEHETVEVAGGKNYGTMYLLDFVMCHGDKSAMVRSVWIVRQLEDFPRLVSCYVHKSALGGD